MKKAIPSKYPKQQIVLVAITPNQGIICQAGTLPKLPTINTSDEKIEICDKKAVSDLIRQKTNIFGKITRTDLMCIRDEKTFYPIHVVVLNKAKSFTYNYTEKHFNDFFDPANNTVFDDPLSEAIRRFVIIKREKEGKTIPRKVA